MNEKNNVKKLIKKYFSEFAKDNDFTFQRPTTLLKINKDVLQIIYFDFGSAGYTCCIALQPLYVPSDSIILSFGNC